MWRDACFGVTSIHNVFKYAKTGLLVATSIPAFRSPSPRQSSRVTARMHERPEGDLRPRVSLLVKKRFLWSSINTSASAKVSTKWLTRCAMLQPTSMATVHGASWTSSDESSAQSVTCSSTRTVVTAVIVASTSCSYVRALSAGFASRFPRHREK